MATLRWILLSMGLVLICIAVIGMAKNTSVEIPVVEEPAKPGLFQEFLREDFDIVQRATYEFSPSQSTQEQAGRHVTLHRFVPRTWYEFAPSPATDMPLVILLHGAGRDGLSVVEMWKDIATEHGIALLAPNARGASWPLMSPTLGSSRH